MGHLPEPWTSSATLYMDSPACSACRPTPAAGAAGGRWRFCRLCPPSQRWASPPQGPRARVRAASCPVAPPGGRQRQRPSSGPEPSARGGFVLLSWAPRAPPEAAGERGQALPGTAWARGRPHECRGCKQGVPWSSADRHCTSQQRAACRRRRRRYRGVLPLACGQASLLDTRGPGVAGRGRVWPGDEKTQAKELVGILGCHLDLPPPRAQHPTAAGRRWPWASAPWIGRDYRPGRSRSRVLWRSGRGERGASWHLASWRQGSILRRQHLAAAGILRYRPAPGIRLCRRVACGTGAPGEAVWCALAQRARSTGGGQWALWPMARLPSRCWDGACARAGRPAAWTRTACCSSQLRYATLRYAT